MSIVIKIKVYTFNSLTYEFSKHFIVIDRADFDINTIYV